MMSYKITLWEQHSSVTNTALILALPHKKQKQALVETEGPKDFGLHKSS